jgi:type IV secretion system protein VirB1
MDFNLLALECAPWVAPQTMAAIVKTESQFNPLAININAGAKLERQPKSKQEAVVTAKWLLANNYNIDMGLGQVNSANLAKTKLSVEDAFDECKNLTAAASILKWNFQSASKKIPGEQAALQAAISAYNTGSFTRGFSNGYVQKVVNSAINHNLKKTTVTKVSDIKPIQLIDTTKVKIAKPAAEAPQLPPIKNNDFNQEANTQNLSELAVYRDTEITQNIMVYR